VLKISKAALVAAVLSLSAVPATLPAQAATTTTGITTELNIPTITAVDSSMDETALRDALSGGFSKHVDEIAKLNATSITIPEITLKISVPDGKANSTVTYKDIVLTNVKDGVAESASVGSADSTSAEGTFSLGKLSTGTLDFGGILALYSLVPAGAPDQPMKALYKGFKWEGATFTGPTVSCNIGQVTADEFDARPLKISFAQMMEASQQLKDAGTGAPPPEATATMISFFADMFQAFKSTPLSVGPVACKGTDEKGEPFELAIAGINMDGYQPGIYPAITVTGLSVKAGADGVVSLGEAKLKQIGLQQPIAVLEGQKDLSPAWLETNMRKLIPSFEGFSVTDLKIDVPDTQSPGTRVNANIASIDVTLSDYLNGIPTKISTKADGVDVPLPADSTDENVKTLLALGITKVNLGYDLEANWDKDSQTIKVDKAAISGKDLGSFAVAALLGNAAEQLFDPDNNVMQAAAMNLTFKSLGIDVTDAGLGDKLVPLLASQQGADPATYRTQLAGIAEGSALQLLGATDAARALGQAVSSFVTGTAKSLNVTVTAKDALGLSLPQLMQAQNNPAALTSAIDITGTAQ